MSTKDFLALPFTGQDMPHEVMIEDLTERIVGYAVRSGLALGMDGSDVMLALINATGQGAASAFLHGHKGATDIGPYATAIAAVVGARAILEIQVLNIHPIVREAQ